MQDFGTILELKAKSYFEDKSYLNAIFYAEKLVSIRRGKVNSLNLDLNSLHLLFDCYFASKQYKQVHHLIVGTYSNLCVSDLKSIHVACKCLEASENWDELLRFLGDDHAFATLIESNQSKFLPSLCFLRGKAYDRKDNKKKAIPYYVQALNQDPYMVEAFDSAIILLKHSLRSKLVESLNLKDDWLKLLYQSKVDTFRIGSSELKILKETYGLEKNVDIMLRDAENYFNIQKYSQADSIAKQIMKFDPFNMACMPLYVNILVELGRKSELYNLANDLVTNDPKSALGWYAVGCYYYSTQKYEQARKYFTKSTQIDGKFVPSWIALGHSYAFTDETDFAMNAYRMGGKLYPGSHIPPLCIGIECIKTGTFQLAESTLALVGEICNTDPVLYNEYGVIQYRMGNYQNAIKYFQNVVKLSPEEEFQVTSSKSLETAHFNLGHAYRKLEMFDEAIKHYEIADKISHDGSVDGSLGFCYHLKGDFQKAIEYYHKGLAMNPEDAFINDMIPKALSLYANK